VAGQPFILTLKPRTDQPRSICACLPYPNPRGYEKGKGEMSCGNPSQESEALMPRTSYMLVLSSTVLIIPFTVKPKFDKYTTCVRCKQSRGNIVVRHAVYCKCAL
jgi:hypothetical protein